MLFHDLKIRDAKRLALGALGCAALFALGLCFRSTVEPIVNRLPTRATHEYFGLMLVLATFAIILSYMAIRYLRTSPAQNAEYLNRSARGGQELPSQFDPELLDPADPYFEVKTLDYLLNKRAAQLKG